MKIYTKGGDNGETSLPDGKRVPKYHPFIEILGSMEEVASQIGFLGSIKELPKEEKKVLENLVGRAMEIISCLATSKKIDHHEYVMELEKFIDQYQQKLPPLKEFVLPTGSFVVCAFHVVRTNIRRIERNILKANNELKILPDWVKAWINRISDFLFILSLYLREKEKGQTK